MGSRRMCWNQLGSKGLLRGHREQYGGERQGGFQPLVTPICFCLKGLKRVIVELPNQQVLQGLSENGIVVQG